MPSESMTYAGTGVDYDAMDPFKRQAQLAALKTARNIDRLNNGEFKELTASRGESVYLIEAAKSYFAHVEEGLGTKNLVADAMYELTGNTYYHHIAQDTVAMIVNDMITAGALPLSVAMHLAVGESSWFDDNRRRVSLITGWRQACTLARCTWGGGETPTLKDIVMPRTAVLSGSAFGLVKPKDRLITPDHLEDGDAIVLVESSGIHANGLTMARSIPERLPDGYLTELSDGRTYGDTLLDPTHIYVGLVEDCQNAGVDIHYAVNITGHGWRKLMRAPDPYMYVIEELPRQQPIFDFIQKHGPVDDREAYGNFNMGAGFALYVPKHDADKVTTVASSLGLRAFNAGFIKADTEKSVIVPSLKLIYHADELTVR